MAETLSIEPSVFKIREFLRGHEVQELVSLALSANINHDDLAWSRTSDGRRSSIRSSRSAWIGKHFGAALGALDSPTVQAVLERAATLIGTNASCAEGIQVVRYPARSQFRHHQDAHEPEDSLASFGGRNRLPSSSTSTTLKRPSRARSACSLVVRRTSLSQRARRCRTWMRCLRAHRTIARKRPIATPTAWQLHLALGTRFCFTTLARMELWNSLPPTPAAWSRTASNGPRTFGFGMAHRHHKSCFILWSARMDKWCMCTRRGSKRRECSPSSSSMIERVLVLLYELCEQK